MTWEVASFLVLATVLVAGFAWYERSRPPSQVVALVAALAALAVAGRIALVAIPNVVATTDIALFAGYALGPAPGFVVGALAALVSNFWLGQGPWTPWQMAGWGLCGAGGATLAMLTARRAGRLGLAAACGLAGILYGALLNFSLMATYGGELSLERFLTLQARAVPFDAAHAIGNVTLALVAGPAMVRMLIRFRERFEWRRAQPGAAARRALATGAALVALAVPLALAPAAAADRDAAAKWLAARQASDGGFAADPGGDSSPEMTGWVVLGLEAAGRNPLDVREGGHSAVAYLRSTAGSISGPGDLARTVLALSAAGVEPRDFAGRNLVSSLRHRMRRDGSFQGQVNLTAFAILALRGADSPKGLRHSLAWLRSAQNRDGGWGFAEGAASDADSTGAALQAVRGSRAARRGVRWLRRHQNRTGGWALAGRGAVNSQSTAWAIQGLLAAGVEAGRVREGGRSGYDYLAARQAADGHYRYSMGSDQTPIWVTGQALVAASGKSLPLEAVSRRKKKKERQGSGGGTAGSGGGGGSAGGVGAGVAVPDAAVGGGGRGA
ncbi:MAG TPA: prenyltransferase/squalene oxidase repeat-containing protein, partial [Solirubrobacterales bacterium]|nr:prenyltransferase/squalene oxidase repeat-containing protein [Solirubrobacterales bacterium]